jgi:hypothetical protein
MRDGTLILHLRASQLASEIAVPFGVDSTINRGEPISQYRYTVHTSRDSTQGINTINLHQDLMNGQSLDPQPIQFTTAIKRTKNFAFLYGRQCSALLDPRYDLSKSSDKFISLGPLTKEFTLVFGVFLGPADTPFFADGRDFQSLQVCFKEFSVVLLWSFLPHLRMIIPNSCMLPRRRDLAILQATQFPSA